MNEQLQKELAAWLSQLRGAAESGVNFALEQAPLVVQEKILYGRVVETVWLLIGLACVAACIVLLPKMWRKAIHLVNNERWDEITYIPCVITTIVATIPTFFIVEVHIAPVIKVWFAPRLYVVEWLATLVK